MPKALNTSKENTSVDPDVRNGSSKMVVADYDFMNRQDIYECVKQL